MACSGLGYGRACSGVGEVHDGLWAGLHQQDPASSAGHNVLDRIMHCLQSVSKQKQIYLCGHSLGGGLVSMLSLILPTRHGFALSHESVQRCWICDLGVTKNNQLRSHVTVWLVLGCL